MQWFRLFATWMLHWWSTIQCPRLSSLPYASVGFKGSDLTKNSLKIDFQTSNYNFRSIQHSNWLIQDILIRALIGKMSPPIDLTVVKQSPSLLTDGQPNGTMLLSSTMEEMHLRGKMWTILVSTGLVDLRPWTILWQQQTLKSPDVQSLIYLINWNGLDFGITNFIVPAIPLVAMCVLTQPNMPNLSLASLWAGESVKNSNFDSRSDILG